MLKITSLQNSKIKEFEQLKIKKYRDEKGLFILDDKDLIERAILDNKVVTLLYVGQIKKVPENIELIEVTESIINKLASTVTPTNMIAICKKFDLDVKGNFVVALDDVQDPGNGGTILRSALAFNYEEILLSEKSFDQYNEKFIRATKGSVFDLSIKRLNLVNELKQRKDEGYEIVIADLNKDAIKLEDFKTPKKMVLVLGNEGNGISKDIKEIATKTLYIPISSKIESLNVAVAGSIIMSKIHK